MIHQRSASCKQNSCKAGVNTIYANELSHLYINYMMDDVNLKYTELPKIRIHVEGGRANGYFDATKMQNEDWNKLRDLKQDGFFNDDVIRLKSKHTIHSLSLSGVGEQQKQGNWNYNGEDKGITGVLGKWDWVHELEQEYFRPEQFEGRFNCLMFSTDAAGLYAFPYGTFIGTVSTTFSYKEWAKGGQYDDGGTSGLWCTKLVTTIRNSSTWHAAWRVPTTSGRTLHSGNAVQV